MELGNSKNKDTMGIESPHKNSIKDKEFGKIFGFTGENTNYMSWKRLAAILEIKDPPTSTQKLKEAIDRMIGEMEWRDVDELLKLYTIKHSSKKPKSQKKDAIMNDGKQEEDEQSTTAQQKKIDRIEGLLMKMID